MKKRVRTAWQRTPKIIQEAVDEAQSLVNDQAKIIERLRRRVDLMNREADQLRADGRNLLVQRDTAQRALELLIGVSKIDVVIPAPERSGLTGPTTYFILTDSNAIPVFGVMPGDKILIARKKVL